MDISKIDSKETLQSMAYEQVVAIETGQANLRALQQRIAELAQAEAREAEATAKK